MRRLLTATLLASLALTGCKTVSRGADKVETVAADILVPPDQERQIGQQVAAEVQSKSKLLNNPAVQSYVDGIGNKVVSASEKSEFNITFLVIDDPKTVNAFAIPGGRIYVFTGLLKAAKNEAEVAGVLAHEVAHVTSRHVAKRLVQAYGLQAVAGAALGKDPGMMQQIVAAIAVNGTLLRNSREAEAEADTKGVRASAKAGYDPHQMVAFFETLKKEEGSVPGVLKYVSDHPLTADRISSLNEQIAKEHLSGAAVNAEQHAAIVKQLP